VKNEPPADMQSSSHAFNRAVAQTRRVMAQRGRRARRNLRTLDRVARDEIKNCEEMRARLERLDLPVGEVLAGGVGALLGTVKRHLEQAMPDIAGPDGPGSGVDVGDGDFSAYSIDADVDMGPDADLDRLN